MAKKINPNYIEHGSPEHAVFLGLRKATPEDELQIDGWALVDMTAYGPTARPEFLKEVLRQKVTEWKTKPIMPQSDDPRKKGYTQPIFDPHPGERSDIPNVSVAQS